jgi:hypothetical protein
MQEDVKTNKPKQEQERELDLGIFFSLIGKIIRGIIRVVKAFFLLFFDGIISILLFIKRKLIWLVIGGLIGFGFGLYRYLTKGPSYFSDLYVRANFESSRLLYNQIDYYNALIKEDRFAELATDFKLPLSNAKQLIRFEISPVDNDLEAAKLYRSTFLQHLRTPNSNIPNSNLIDTQWAKTMKFKDFKESLEPYDFPLQKIRLYSSNSNVYNKVEAGMISSINNHRDFQRVKQGMIQIFKNEEEILNRSLLGLDSLRMAYNKNLIEMASVAKTTGTGIVVTDKTLRTPEIDLYDKELIVKDELMDAKKRAVEQQDILQVNASFSPVGTKRAGVNQDFFKYAWWGLLISFAILVLIDFYKYLDKIDNRKKLDI